VISGSPAIPALMAAIVLLAPRIGALSWKTFEAKLSWALILTVGASMSRWRWSILPSPISRPAWRS
jgi:hypothetical protein